MTPAQEALFERANKLLDDGKIADAYDLLRKAVGEDKSLTSTIGFVQLCKAHYLPLMQEHGRRHRAAEDERATEPDDPNPCKGGP